MKEKEPPKTLQFFTLFMFGLSLSTMWQLLLARLPDHLEGSLSLKTQGHTPFNKFSLGDRTSHWPVSPPSTRFSLEQKKKKNRTHLGLHHSPSWRLGLDKNIQILYREVTQRSFYCALRGAGGEIPTFWLLLHTYSNTSSPLKNCL